MADFKTHITTSTILGIGYGATGYLSYEVPLSTSLLAGGLCSLAGMLPDLDSDSGVPIRESMAFAAAVTPMLMIDRLQQMGLSHESIVLAGGCIYIIIRFGIAELLKRFTVHRGMFHSLPAAAIAGLLAFLICSCPGMTVRWYKVGAVVLGFMSHLVLDELYAVEWYRGRLRLKKSFGTALKFWSNSRWASLFTYAQLVVLVALAAGDPLFMEQFGTHRHEFPHVARDVLDDVIEQSGDLLHR